MAGQQFEYGFDDIGNRKVARRGGDENGWNLRESVYTPNLLNQYTNRTVPGFADVVGVALATKPVYGNGEMASRKGEYFRRELSVNNAGGPVWLGVTVTSPGEPTVTGNLFVPRTPEAFTHDLDGNLTSDGRWTYWWDAENRLIRVQSRSDTPQGSWRRVEWQYDALGRRIRQTTWSWLVQSNLWVVTEDLKFVSDPLLFGRHVVDLNATNNVPVRTYVWGLDLSGTLDGAGGVGGLLWMTLHTASGAAAGTHFCAYDGNGNIVALSAPSDGSPTARYEYGPFAEPIRLTGPAAALNPFRFSTKRTDPTTDLVLYEYRAYSPTLGRWLSRDPIGEPGQKLIVKFNRRASRASRSAELQQGPNLFAYVANNPKAWVDPDGRALWGPSFSPQSLPNPSPALEEIDYPWYVDVFGAVCDVGSVVSICFDIATIPSGEGAVATVCLQACKQSLKRRIKEKIACDALYRRIHGNPPGTGACDKPQSCRKNGLPIEGMPMGWYLERAVNALECSALRTAWLKKCACKGLKNKKWHGKDWETHWRDAGIAAANFAICINQAKKAGWEGDVPSIPQ